MNEPRQQQQFKTLQDEHQAMRHEVIRASSAARVKCLRDAWYFNLDRRGRMLRGGSR